MNGRTTPRAKAAPARALAVGILWACLLSCLSCANPFTAPSKSAARTSSLKLSIGAQASQSIVPGATDYLNAIKAYKVAVSNGGNTYTSTTVVSGSCTFTDIATGTYTVTVQAFSDAGATTQIAQGTTSATVTAGTTTAASVTLSFTKAASTGGLSLNMAWPISTGLAYAYATIDGNPIADPAVLAGPTNYTATLIASNLPGGAHTLSIYFKASSSATIALGPYIETVNVWDGVTDTMWADSSGALQSTLSLYPSEFPASDANLAGLSVATVGLGTGFLPGTNVYGFGSAPSSGTSYSFTVTADTPSQGVACTFNGSPCTLTAASATALTGSFTAVSGLNTLVFTVTAADRKTTNTYMISSATLIMGGSYTSSTFQASVSTVGNYLLAGDVTISDSWTTPIGGSTTAYTGTFDGNGHSITMAGGSTNGLFYTVAGTGLVENLNVSSTMNPTGTDRGMLADFVNSGGRIYNCSSSGTVSGGVEIGGLVGAITTGGFVANCTNAANVSGNTAVNTGGICAYCGGGTISYCVNVGSISGTDYQIGGIAGMVSNNGIVRYSYNAGTITGTGKFIGGLCGRCGETVGSTTGFLYSCYNAGTVSAPSASIVGGLAGAVEMSGSSVTNCYNYGLVTGASQVGGLVGSNGGSVDASVYDSAASGQSDDTGKGAPEATTAMKSLALYVGASWSISTSLDGAVEWGIDLSGVINHGYPYLQQFGASTVSP